MGTVLVIDDERLTGDMLRTVMAPLSQHVLCASSGPEGVKLFQEHGADLVIIDLRMPIMDGVTTLTEIRACNPSVPIIILTAVGTPSEEARARQAGANEFLYKSLPMDQILAVMQRYIVPPSASARPVHVKPPADGQPPAPPPLQGSIMVVDDEPLIGEMVRRYFSHRGFRVLCAKDGPTALGIAAREQPNVTILDMHMPDMTGLMVLQALRAQGYMRPVIILSASQDEALLKAALDDGAIDVMAKPVDLKRMETVIAVGMVWGEEK